MYIQHIPDTEIAITKKDKDDTATTVEEHTENTQKTELRSLVKKIFGTSSPSPRVIEIADQQALREEMRNGLHPSCVQSPSQSSIEDSNNCICYSVGGSAIVGTDNVRHLVVLHCYIQHLLSNLPVTTLSSLFLRDVVAVTFLKLMMLI